MTETPAPSVLELIRAPHPDRAPLPSGGAPGVRELRGVPYAEVADGRPLELDLWRPERRTEGPMEGRTESLAESPMEDPVEGLAKGPAEGPAVGLMEGSSDGLPEAPLPLVVFVHGGAWMRGRRDDMGFRTRQWSPGPFARIAAAGFAVACVDYRLSGEAPFPAALDDLRAALRWLTLRGPELGIDTSRTVVWGESAGGHLASLLALTHTAPRPAGAVIWYAPSDLTTPRGYFTPDSPATPEALLLGAAPSTAPERARAASPLSLAHRDAPPYLLVHGEADTMVDSSHSTALAAALETSGAPVELWTVPDADHGWHGLPDATVEGIFQRSLDFARHHTTPSGTL